MSVSPFQNEKFGAFRISIALVSILEAAWYYKKEKEKKKYDTYQSEIFFKTSGGPTQPPRMLRVAHYICNKRAAGGEARSNSNYTDCCNVSD